MKRLLAVYSDQTRARRTVEALVEKGFSEDEISVLAADSASGQTFMSSAQSNAPLGALAGAAVGSSSGLLTAATIGSGMLFTGPIGLVFASTVAGGLLGALTGLGIPENEAEIRALDIADGAILVGVDVEAETCRAELAREAFYESETLYVTAVTAPAD